MAERILNLKPSKNVQTGVYDDETQTLTLTLKGGVYRYESVDADKAAAFEAADSHGQFLHSQIKGQHQFAKIG